MCGASNLLTVVRIFLYVGCDRYPADTSKLTGSFFSVMGWSWNITSKLGRHCLSGDQRDAVWCDAFTGSQLSPVGGPPGSQGTGISSNVITLAHVAPQVGFGPAM